MSAVLDHYPCFVCGNSTKDKLIKYCPNCLKGDNWNCIDCNKPISKGCYRCAKCSQKARREAEAGIQMVKKPIVQAVKRRSNAYVVMDCPIKEHRNCSGKFVQLFEGQECCQYCGLERKEQ